MENIKVKKNININQRLYDLLVNSLGEDKIEKFVEGVICYHLSKQMSEKLSLGYMQVKEIDDKKSNWN